MRIGSSVTVIIVLGETGDYVSLYGHGIAALRTEEGMGKDVTTVPRLIMAAIRPVA